ncbi:hypothetical protein BC332_01974 [Capsicum chinense]|nr:hypothetical protein BC332_01974 [Capsicum chinense]
MMKIHMVAMVMVQNLDSDAEDLQNLVDEEMNRSHQSDQDEYLSDSDSEEYDHQENDVDEEEAAMCESIHAFFDGYITGQSPLKQFVEQYEVALRFKYEKEIESQTSERK